MMEDQGAIGRELCRRKDHGHWSVVQMALQVS